MPASIVKLLNAVTATGAGPTVDLGYVAKDSVAVMTLTGGPTTVTCPLECSADGVNWITYSTANLTQAALSLFMTARPTRFIRANLTALVGGVSPTVTVWVTISS